jgi:peptidoglycan/LPS O-acetylase OafA/YrhL
MRTVPETGSHPSDPGDRTRPVRGEARDSPFPATEHRADIQGLRAVAVLLVALTHAGASFLQGGYVGVDVFFVLSGFLITGLLVSEAIKHRSVSLVNFYARRARRILPAAALTLVATDLVAYHLLNFVRAKQVMEDSIAAALFTANIHFANQGNDYFARGQPPSPILHFWTLAVEEQFYVVWPALLSLVLFGVALGRRRFRRYNSPVSERALLRLLVVIVAAAIASLAWSIHDTEAHPISAYFSSFTRAWELALGAALAIASARVARIPARSRAVMGWLGLAAITAAGVLFSSSTPFPGYAALLPTGGSALVIAAGIGNRPRFGVGRLLALAPLRYIGDRSYTFYLWHWPVLILALQYKGHELSFRTNLLLLLAAFLLSVATYRLFENPIRRAKWSTTTTVSLWPVSASIVIVVAGFSLQFINNKNLASRQVTPPVARPPVRNSSTPARADRSSGEQAVAATSRGEALPAVIAAVRAARRGERIPANLTPPVAELLNPDYAYSLNLLPDHPEGCASSDGRTTSNICRLGDTSSSKMVVLMGDSHAEMWMPPIVGMAEQDGRVVVPLVKSGCTPNKWVESGEPECRAWYRWAVQQAKALHPDVMLVSGASGGASGGQADEIKRAFLSIAGAMKTSSTRVIVIADDEGVDQQPVDCLLARGATMRSCTTTWPEDRFYFNNDLAAIANRRGFSVLPTRGWFCFENQCPMVVGRTIVYRDQGHITEAYGLALAGPFRAAFRRTVGEGRGQ